MAISMTVITGMGIKDKILRPKVSKCPYRALSEFKQKTTKAPAKWVCADLTDDRGESVAIWEAPGTKPGTGIGLYEMRDAVEWGGGKLWVNRKHR